jgi:hypothetical protein
MPSHIHAFYSWRIVRQKFEIQNVFAIMGMEFGWASPERLDEMFIDDLDYHGIFWWANWIEKENKKIKEK